MEVVPETVERSVNFRFFFSLFFCVPFAEKGKASFSESDGVTILMKIVQDSEDEEMIDLMFEIFTSVIVDGKCFLYVFWELGEGVGGGGWRKS